MDDAIAGTEPWGTLHGRGTVAVRSDRRGSPQWTAHLFYSRRHSLPLGKMGERLQTHRTSVTNIVDRLEHDGPVERRPHERDRRTMLAAITPEGRRMARRATQVLMRERFGTSTLGEVELRQLFDVLRGVRVDAGDLASQ